MTTLDAAPGPAEPHALLSCASQVSYITDDIDAFEARLRDHFGVERFLIRHDHSRNSPGSSGAIRHLGLALVDGIEVEIIQPNPDKPSIYRQALELNGGVGRLHHINHRLNRREQWREAEAMVTRLELPVELQGGFGDDLRFSYPDARADLGHFLEFSYMEGAAAPSFPVPDNRPAPGASLFGGCFQRGYVTSDLEAAVSRLADGYGVTRFERVTADDCEVARAWTGRFLLELIQPTAAAIGLYGCAGPELMRLHHLGFAAEDHAAFDRLAERAGDLGLSVSPNAGDSEMREMYVDAREVLGHHLKYVAPAEAARRRYASAPRN